MQAIYENMKCTTLNTENAHGPTVNHPPDSLLDHAELSLSIQPKQQKKRVMSLTVLND